MKLDIEFKEQDQEIKVDFGNISIVSDGGYEKGYNDGFSLGETQGYNNGYSQGESEGYAKGETDGFSKGYDKGEADGYNNGYGNALTKLDEIEITENGQYLPSEDKIGFSKVNVNVKSTAVEEKIVDFIDYDGTLLYSYSIEEAKALTEMPPLPEQKGLICQEWNWSFEDLQGYIADMEANDLPVYKITIGATYITDDGKTRVYISLKDGFLSPTVGFGINGTATIDWGDGSELSTITGTSTSRRYNYSHNYSQEGDYVISIEVINGELSIFGDSTSTFLISNANSSRAALYSGSIKKVEIGANTSIGQYAFSWCCLMKTLTIPKGIKNIQSYTFYICPNIETLIIPNSLTDIAGYSFVRCTSLLKLSLSTSISIINYNTFDVSYSEEPVKIINITIPKSLQSSTPSFEKFSSLKSITIPNGILSMNGFSNCKSLTSVTLPSTLTDTARFKVCLALHNVTLKNGIKTIQNDTFYLCYSLREIFIPSSVSTIKDSAFYDCRSLIYIDFSTHTQIPTLSSTNVFSGVSTACEIRVPMALVDAWKSATNWSAYASRIIGV